MDLNLDVQIGYGFDLISKTGSGFDQTPGSGSETLVECARRKKAPISINFEEN